jgi:hypothetical protein
MGKAIRVYASDKSDQSVGMDQSTMGALWQTDSHQAEADSPSPAPLPKKFRPPRPWRRLFWLILLLVLLALGFAVLREMHSARWQARTLSQWAAQLTYRVEPGASDAILYPGAGPFDQRLGYSALGDFLPRLLKRNYVIESQARFSAALMN